MLISLAIVCAAYFSAFGSRSRVHHEDFALGSWADHDPFHPQNERGCYPLYRIRVFHPIPTSLNIFHALGTGYGWLAAPAV